jgi:hypothetical protein
VEAVVEPETVAEPVAETEAEPVAEVVEPLGEDLTEAGAIESEADEAKPA